MFWCVCLAAVFFTLNCVLAVPCPPKQDFHIISREEWGARSPVKPPTPLINNISDYVVIHHSATKSCSDKTACKKLVKSFQNYHIDERGWNDIGYNFLIGEDGNIYEGRGWGITGAHTPGFNNRSIGICIMGDFTNVLPNRAALTALDNFVSYAVKNEEITPLFKLFGHRQATSTECPGNKLFKLIKTWTHWFPNPKNT